MLKMLCLEFLPVADPPAHLYSNALQALCAYARWCTGFKALRKKQ